MVCSSSSSLSPIPVPQLETARIRAAAFIQARVKVDTAVTGRTSSPLKGRRIV